MGKFGDSYIDRNASDVLLSSDTALFSQILKNCRRSDVRSVIEFGSNIGMNLKAMSRLIPDLRCTAVEINHKAAEILRNDKSFQKPVEVFETSILDYIPADEYNFVLIKGVLIHINPDYLEKVYKLLYQSSNKYVCIAEYYNPTPVIVNYRGNTDKLFKRDFAGEFMDLYPDVKLVDYGFSYHRDNIFPQDDATWFLMEK